MTRAAWVATVGAVLLAVVTAVALAATATEATTAVTPLVTAGVCLLVVFLVVGSSRWVGVASVPMMGAIVLESGFSDDPSWTRSILIGCLWFVTMEASWEAIERRSAGRHTRAANDRRVQEIVTVVAVALVMGLVAVAATAVAPVRSVLLQAMVLAGLLTVFVTLVRASARPRHDAG